MPDLHRPYNGKSLTIIGLGNELLSDDGAGIRVVRELKKRLGADAITFHELSVGGLQLLDYIVGHDHCIIVDAVVTGTHPPGTMLRFVQTADSEPVRLSSSHQVDLTQVVSLAQLFGADIPRRLVVYGIEAGDITTFRDGCTEEVSRAIPRLVEAICSDVEEESLACGTPAGAWQLIPDVVPE